MRDGAYVLALHRDEWTSASLRGDGWCLHALNPAWPDLDLPDLGRGARRGHQAAVPGRRKLTRHYA